MKIAVLGCGAVGSFYGAALSRSGSQVHFLLRSDFAVVQRQGVRIRSIQGDFEARPHCARTPQEIGCCDLVLVALKTTANEALPQLLPPLLGPRTLVLTLQNGLGSDEYLASFVEPGRVLGGLCFVCLNRMAPGVIRHTAHGLVVVGGFSGDSGAATTTVAELFQHAGIPCQITDNLKRARWEKLVWNIPFNGLGVAGAAGYDAVIAGRLLPHSVVGPTLPTSILLSEPRWERLLEELMAEVVHAAEHLGLPLPAGVAAEQIQRTRNMGAYQASTLLDFEAGRPLELESMFLEPLRRSRRAGVEPPRLAALCRLLQQLEQQRNVQPCSPHCPAGGVGG